MKWRLPVYVALWTICVVMMLRVWRPDVSEAPPAGESPPPAAARVAPEPVLTVADGRGYRASESWPVVEPSTGGAPAHRRPGDDGSAAEPFTLEGEQVLRFYDARDAQRFAAMAETAGIAVTGHIPELNLVRVRVSDEMRWRRVLERGPLALDRSSNHRVWSPERHVPPDPPEGVEYQPFGAAVPAWLGLDTPWLPGGSVTVALLDDGIEPHWAFGDTAIREYDLIGAVENAMGRRAGAHGSAMASLLSGNTRAAPGVAAGMDLISYRVLGQDGTGDAFTLAAAIVAAVEAGARVINCSLGTYADNLALREAVAHAHARQVSIVAAAGNDGFENRLLYPAAYATVVAVAAVDAAGRHLWFSNQAGDIDLAAPGYGVHAAWTNETIASMSGTSVAAALVSGSIARLLSRDPDLSPDAVRAVLRTTSDDYGIPGPDATFGAGILNLARLERWRVPGLYEITIRPPAVRIDEHDSDSIKGVFYAQNTGTEKVSWVDLDIRMDLSTRRFSFHNVPPGDTVTATFEVGRAGGRPRSRDVAIKAYIRQDSARNDPVDRLETVLVLE